MLYCTTDAEHVIVFEKTLIGDFSCVNTRLAFDTDILLNDDKKKSKILFDLHVHSKKQKEFLIFKVKESQLIRQIHVLF